MLIEIDPDVIRIDTPYRPRGEYFVKAASVDEPRSSPKILKITWERRRDAIGCGFLEYTMCME